MRVINVGKQKRKEDGFTLIELMIVVAIIGILAALAIPNFMKYQAKSKQSEAKLNLSAIYTNESSYFGENGTFGTFTQVGWEPVGTVKLMYNYDDLCGGTGDKMGNTTATVTASVSACGVGVANSFTAVATANLDSDVALDIWRMNDIKRLWQELTENDV